MNSLAKVARIDPTCPAHHPEAASHTSPSISHGGPLGELDLPLSLADILRRCVERHGEGQLIHISPDGTESGQTYAALWDDSVRIARGLRNRGLPEASPVLLQCHASRDFLAGFWGAVLGGFVPVPVPAPAANKPDSHAGRRARSIWEFLEKPLVLICDRQVPLLRSMVGEDQSETFACVEQLRQCERDDGAHAGADGALALMMLTSGSTGAPKAAMLTHRNVLAELAGLQQRDGLRSEEPVLNWMPLDHVAGLVLLHLWGVYVGCEQIHVAPAYILQDPLRWLDLLQRYRVAVTFAPEFGYRLVNEQERDIVRRRWDLSRVRHFLNGGEAIVSRTARRFLKLLAPHGLRPDAMRPAWGMSELCSAATFSERFSLESTFDDDLLVELGLPIPGVELRIVDEQGRVVPEGIAGRLQCRGATVTPGYWRSPELTRAAFTADGWFKTGDTAFLRGGRLTLTGREKDIIIVHGRNYPSHEIEAAVNEIDAVATSFTAACAVRDSKDHRERTAIFFVCRNGHEESLASITHAIRSRVLTKVGINPDYLLCVSPADVPRSPIGKIQRSRLRERFEAGEFDGAIQAGMPGARPALVAPRTPLEQQLAAVWAEVLGHLDFGVEDNFFELGGHSLLAMRLMARAGELLQRDLPVALLFESPTVESLAQRIEALEPDEGPVLGPIKPLGLGPGDLCRAAFAQERLRFLNDLVPESPVYNIPIALRLSGALNIEALQSALDALVVRHAALRTTFRTVNGLTMQVVGVPRAVNLKRMRQPAGDGHDDLAGVLRGEARRPFDLSADLTFRAVLYEVDAQHHVLLIVVHHIAFDGWSEGVFFRDLGSMYSAFVKGDAVSVAEPWVQYTDYSLWQRQWMDGPVRQRHAAFWRKYFEGAPPALELSVDRARPARPTYGGALLQRRLPDGFERKVNALARRERATPFMVWLAIVKALLYRYTGQDDIVIGTAVSGRSRAELEPIIGFFVNTIPLRTDLSDAPSFRELVQRVRRATLAAYSHQDMPFEQIVHAVHPTREANRSVLFQVMFLLEDVTDAPPLTGVRSERLPVHTGTAMFDVTLTVRQERGDSHLLAEYNVDLFDAGTIERMLANFHRLLEAALEDPDKPVGRLGLLAEVERQQLLLRWNDTAVAYPLDKCVHQLFEGQVERTPDAVAVVCEGQQLTYRQLNEQSNQLAHYLRSVGVGPETLVGLCLERSPELVIGVLGILKAGAAYVPLGADHPPQRLQFLIRDAAVEHLVTHKALLDRIPPNDCNVTCLGDNALKLDACGRSNPAVAAATDNLAYVIYTSGSTGEPKGVAVSHANLSNLLMAIRLVLEIGLNDRFLGIASPAFDISVAEILLPLVSGATTILVRTETAKDAKSLARAISASQANIVQATPSSLMLLLESGWQGSDELTVISTGEALPRSLAGRLLDMGCRLLNFYGPTETTIWSTVEHITNVGACGSIGRPIANTQAYVLDGCRQPVPIGVPGELYIGGAGVARGYLNRPELTADRFIANPFDDAPQARLYRTGDVCRWRADGKLEFLGRNDDQVKLRGFRIELGEIEAVLNQHPSVVQSVVTLREDRPGDKRLVAYCVTAGGAALDVTDLTRHVRTKLPDYMIPSAFVPLDAFPLTPSGKINRRALPAPPNMRPELESHYVAPRNALEKRLASIWCELLSIERVGIHDNFFALGGHSLMAARVAAALQMELPLRKLFEAPTIAALAEEIKLLRNGEAGSSATLLTPIDRAQIDRLPLSFEQQRLWFLEQMEGERTASNMPHAWRLCGWLNTEALRRALDAIVRRHEPLRTTFAVAEGELVQVVRPMERFELAEEDLRGLATDRQDAEIMKRSAAEAEQPFDLSRVLMLRASLLRLAEHEHVLLLTMHHIACDGWSLPVLWRELALLYDAYCRGVDPNLPNLSLQYADYAVWQRKQLAGERLAAQLEYWRKQLEGVSTLELPTDRPRPPQMSYGGAQHDFTLSPELICRLQSLCQAERVTLHMTLLAAFQVLLSRYSGQEDVALGIPTAWRNHGALKDLIGYFGNIQVLRTNLSCNPTFRELLARVRQVSLAAFDHQDLPFEKLVEELRPARHLSRSPLVQVVFQLSNLSDEDLALRELDVWRLPSSSRRVRFDLEVLLRQPRQGADILRGTVFFSTDIFDTSTIERMVGHFVTLLEGIAANPDQRINGLPLLTEAERRQLLVEWKGRTCAYPPHKCVHQLFEEQVDRTPDAVAVVCEGQQLTYRELNERANQLAHYLRSVGVGPETLVGLCLERSPALVIGVLGILKAGAAYVPLDPTYPPERLAFMLADAGIGALVTQKALLSRLSAPRVPIVCLDGATGFAPEARVTPLAGAPRPDHPAYVIYTSGSTGLPKGVVVTHANVVRLLQATQDWFHFGPTDVWTLFHSIAFDFSVWEMWGALCFGGRLVIVPYLVSRSPEAFCQLVRREGVTVLNQTPTAFHQLSAAEEALADGPALRLRLVILGGEALDFQSLRAWFARHDDQTPQLVNMYGITETTIHATFRPVSAADVQAGVRSRIGRPIPDVELYVLDRFQQAVPIAVPGELYVGGAGLARGYLNRPELTAERFLAHPFNRRSEDRLYRTGDQVCWRPDGDLEYLGRIDDQVKLRGFRIELGEVEAVLNQHPSLMQSVVTLREDAPSDKRLVAYCVTAGSALDVTELTRHLRTRLPQYMVPTAFVLLERLPLTPHGKVDRRALPVPERATLAGVGSRIARTPTEKRLVAIWENVLGLERFGIDDDFFFLGGHSLLATQLTVEMRKAFGVDVRLQTLFQAPTIAALARTIEQEIKRAGVKGLSTHTNGFATAEPSWAFVCPIKREGKRPPVVAVHVSHGCFDGVARYLDPDQPFYAMATNSGFDGRVPPLHPCKCVEDLAARYLELLRTFQPVGPYYLIGYCVGGLVAHEMARRLTEQGEDVRFVGVVDAHPIDRTDTRMRRHLRQLSQLGWWAKMGYFWTRLCSRQRALQDAVRHRATIAACRLLRLPVPAEVVRWNIGEANRRMVRAYSVRNYNGRVTLFRAANQPRRHLPTWAPFAAGGVEVYEIPGDHVNMMAEPNAKHLAQRLNASLHKAQTELKSTPAESSFASPTYGYPPPAPV